MSRRHILPLLTAWLLVVPLLCAQDGAVVAENPAVVAAGAQADARQAKEADAPAKPLGQPPVDEAAELVAGKPAQELVGLLGHAKFRVRQKAEDQLVALLETDAGAVEAACYPAYANATDPEVKMRARAVLVAHVLRLDGQRGRGFVGIGLMLHAMFDPAGKLQFGIKITQVMPEYPGAKAGLKNGDLIIGVDDLKLEDQEADQKFMDYVGKRGPGKEVTLKINRAENLKEIKLTLARRPNLVESAKPVDPEELFHAYLESKKSTP